MDVKRTRANNLTHKQVVLLTDWFRRNQELVEAEKLSSREAAALAAEQLGFYVNDNNMRGVASSTPEAIIQFQWPRSAGGTAGGGGLKDLWQAVKILYLVTEELRCEYGVALTPANAEAWRILAEQLGQ